MVALLCFLVVGLQFSDLIRRGDERLQNNNTPIARAIDLETLAKPDGLRVIQRRLSSLSRRTDSSSRRERHYLYAALAESKKPGALELVLSQIDALDGYMYLLIQATILKRQQESKPILIAMARRGSVESVRWVRQYNEFPSDFTVAALLKHPNPEFRKVGLEASDDRESLWAMLDDRDPGVRRCAVQAILAKNERDIPDPMFRHSQPRARDEDEWGMPPKEAIDEIHRRNKADLHTLATHRDWAVRAEFARNVPAYDPLTVRLAQDKDVRVRRALYERFRYEENPVKGDYDMVETLYLEDIADPDSRMGAVFQRNRDAVALLGDRGLDSSRGRLPVLPYLLQSARDGQPGEREAARELALDLLNPRMQFGDKGDPDSEDERMLLEFVKSKAGQEAIRRRALAESRRPEPGACLPLLVRATFPDRFKLLERIIGDDRWGDFAEVAEWLEGDEAVRWLTGLIVARHNRYRTEPLDYWEANTMIGGPIWALGKLPAFNDAGPVLELLKRPQSEGLREAMIVSLSGLVRDPKVRRTLEEMAASDSKVADTARRVLANLDKGSDRR